MKLRIGQRGSLGVQASHSDRIEPDFARALRMTYRGLRQPGGPGTKRTEHMTPALARSVMLTCYEVGVAAGTVERDEWYEARRADKARARAMADGAITRHPSSLPRLMVVPS